MSLGLTNLTTVTLRDKYLKTTKTTKTIFLPSHHNYPKHFALYSSVDQEGWVMLTQGLLTVNKNNSLNNKKIISFKYQITKWLLW